MQKLILETDTLISVNDYRKYSLDRASQTVKTYKTKKAKDFEKVFERYAREQMGIQGWITPDKEFFIRADVTFVFPRTNMDCNNHYKCLFDVLTRAGVWVDDSRVKENVKKVMYNPKAPKIILEIYVDDQIGLFDNIEEYREFREKCSGCKKEGNCTSLNNALEARIKDDIYKNKEDKWTCSKKK